MQKYHDVAPGWSGTKRKRVTEIKTDFPLRVLMVLPFNFTWIPAALCGLLSAFVTPARRQTEQAGRMSEGDSAAAVAGQTEKQSGLVPTSQPQITSTSNPSPDDIRRQVEAEQALTESSKRLQELQDQLEKIKAEKDALQYEKQTAGKSSSPGLSLK